MKMSCKKEADVSRRKNNSVQISGVLTGEFCFDHEINGKSMFSTVATNRRLSGREDNVVLMVSEKLLEKKGIFNMSVKGKRFKGTGEFRSHNVEWQDGSNHLRLYVWITDIHIAGNGEDIPEINEVLLDGYLCRTPLYRRTGIIPEYGKDITDIMLSVSRQDSSPDYVPCILWGRNSVRASFYKVGFRLRCYGRVQSRRYFKVLQKDETGGFGEWREAYEISVYRMEFVSDM